MKMMMISECKPKAVSTRTQVKSSKTPSQIPWESHVPMRRVKNDSVPEYPHENVLDARV